MCTGPSCSLLSADQTLELSVGECMVCGRVCGEEGGLKGGLNTETPSQVFGKGYESRKELVEDW